MIHENRLITALDSNRSYEALRSSVIDALGTRWDDELECYRRGIDSGPLSTVASI
jgi:hypothetical protein